MIMLWGLGPKLDLESKLRVDRAKLRANYLNRLLKLADYLDRLVKLLELKAKLKLRVD
jgi:hypothetical protein